MLKKLWPLSGALVLPVPPLENTALPPNIVGPGRSVTSEVSLGTGDTSLSGCVREPEPAPGTVPLLQRDQQVIQLSPMVTGDGLGRRLERV